MKKYLIIGLIIVLGIGLFVLGYFLRKSKTPVPPGEGGGNPPPSATTPVVTQGKDSQLKLESLGFGVRGFFADKDGGATIVQPSGHIITIKDGKNTLVSETVIAEITQVDFSYDGKKVLFGFGGRNNQQFSVYDIEKKSWQPLVSGVTATAWNPNDLRVAYLLKKTGYSSISTLDFGVSKPTAKEISRVHAEDLELAWFGKDEIAFWNKNNSRVPGSAWKINILTKKLTPLFSDKTSLSLTSDSVGANILASFDKAGALALSLFDKQGELLKELVVKTLPSKCDFNIEEEIEKAVSANGKDKTTQKTYLYCAAPKNFEVITGELMVDSYGKKEVFSLDNFFKFSVPSGSFSLIYEGPEGLDASEVQVADEKLYFINRYDNKLYSIKLES